MSTAPILPPPETLDSVSNPRLPFGLPAGSVRGIMSLLICGFFWMVLLWPQGELVKPLLAHFFLLALVLMAFASNPSGRSAGEGVPFLPWILRVLFVGGSAAVLAFVAVQFPERLPGRLTPDAGEFAAWWGPFMGTMAVGFATGLFARFVLTRVGLTPVFETLRAWLSVVGLLMLTLEIVMVLILTTSDTKPDQFVRYWQAFELAVVSAYFGTRT